jgi:Tol biopolymer transport system component
VIPSAPIAYLDAARQLVVIDGSGAVRPLGAGGVLWASWRRQEHEDIHSWPTWSPDGRTVAAFRIAREGGDSRVVLCVPGSVSEVEGASIGDRMPIYLQWSPDGQRLAVLSQGGDELVLEEMGAARPDRLRPLLRGSH